MRVQQIVSRTILFGASSAILLTTGCASIVGGVHQSVDIDTLSTKGNAVAGAACKLENSKGTWYVTTPGHVTIHRAAGALSISCTKSNQPFGNSVAVSSVRGWLFGNLLFGGLIGIGIDVGTGAGFGYKDHYTVRSANDWTSPANLAAAGAHDSGSATSYPIQPSSTKPFAGDAPEAGIPELPAATRYVTSGDKTMVAAHADEARLCDIDAPLPSITVLTSPQHGTLQVKRGGFAAPDEHALAACTSGFLYGAQLIYRSNPGFQGFDRFRYEVLIGGKRFTRNVDITVK